VSSIKPLWDAACRKQLRPRSDLPNIEAVEQKAWREGWWHALPVGIVTGAGIAVILLKG